MKASKKKADEEAYLSPEKAEEARQEGNELFKGGKYPEAIAKYSDAMKRNPKNHVPYSNRAACYQKLGEWQLALKDADKCVEMDPTFIKGRSRKATIHQFQKEYHKARNDCTAVVVVVVVVLRVVRIGAEPRCRLIAPDFIRRSTRTIRSSRSTPRTPRRRRRWGSSTWHTLTAVHVAHSHRRPRVAGRVCLACGQLGQPNGRSRPRETGAMRSPEENARQWWSLGCAGSRAIAF